MIGLFRRLLDAFVRFALELAGNLVRGILRAPLTAVENAVTVDVRPASADEVVDLRHRVLRAGRPRETARFEGDQDTGTQHWIAVRGREVVGVASVMTTPFPDGEGPTRQLRGMAVAPELQGKGVGGALLRALEADVGAPIWCNARTTAVPFYERHGWRVVGEPFEVEGIGPHRRMVRAT